MYRLPSRFLSFWLLLIPLIIIIALFLPAHLRARQESAVADFTPPMSPAEAQQSVIAAQQAEQSQRNALLSSTQSASQTYTAMGLPRVQTVYVNETGYHVSDRTGFLDFWRRHGGVLVFGYPISEEIVEDGQIVQYFERARLEYHPEIEDPDFQVQLTLLGRELTTEQTFPAVETGSGDLFFPETGYGISDPFLHFWLKRGGLRLFGYPISGPIEEISPVDGQPRIVQYFERARFEHHPDDMAPFYRQQAQAFNLRLMSLYEIRLTDLGRQAAVQRGHAFARSQRLAEVPEWSPILWERRIDVNLTTQQLTAYEGNIPVFRAPITTGKDGFNTPVGSFAIYSQLPMQTMQGTAGGESWYVPNIPWVQYIVGGVAFHGTYWHDLWGTGIRRSHGCINLNIDDAHWLYEWADIGTTVNIFY